MTNERGLGFPEKVEAGEERKALFKTRRGRVRRKARKVSSPTESRREKPEPDYSLEACRKCWQDESQPCASIHIARLLLPCCCDLVRLSSRPLFLVSSTGLHAAPRQALSLLALAYTHPSIFISTACLFSSTDPRKNEMQWDSQYNFSDYCPSSGSARGGR